MRRLIPLIVFAVAAVSFLAFRPATTTDASAVEGVWKTVHVTTTNDEGTQENEVTRLSLVIFTEGHWASFRTGGGPEGREMFPEEPTDEQRLTAFRQYNATAGTYEVVGNEIHTKLLMHRNPNAMAEQGENASAFEMDGDALVRIFTNANNGNSFRVRYERVE